MGAHYQFANTPKQREIMRHLCDATKTGEELTVKDLLSRLSYKVSKQGLLCSIAFLEKHGFLAKRRNGPKSMTVMPTEAGLRRFRINPDPD